MVSPIGSSPTVRRASMDDFEVFVDIMVEAYTTSEPVARALQVTAAEAEVFVRSFLPHYLPLGYSMVLEYDGVPQGVILHQVIERSPSIYDEDIDETFSPKIRIIEEMARSLSEGFWDMIPLSLNRALHGLYVAVRPQFQRRGGLDALAEATTAMCREHDVGIIFLECLNEFLVEAYRPMGFFVIRSIPFSNWKNKDGSQLVPTSQKALHLMIAFTKPTMPTVRSKM